MNKADLILKDTLTQIKEYGVVDQEVRARYKDGEPSYSKYITHVTHRFDISKGEFPIPTLRNTASNGGIAEILWIYQMQSNKLSDLAELGVTWWDDWNVGDGTIGFAYGYVVKRYNLMWNLLKDLEFKTWSRRHIMNLWQQTLTEAQDEIGGLNPCFYMTTWNVRLVGDVYYLDVLLNSRSSDFITAGFINYIQYTALAMMICSHLRYHTKKNWQVGQLTTVIANAHTYLRHEDAVNELLSRESLDIQPTLSLDVDKDFYDIKLEDFKVHNYKHKGKLSSKLELAI